MTSNLVYILNMESIEDVNYVPNHQRLIFVNTEDYGKTKELQRKRTAHTYSTSLNLLNNHNNLHLLETNLSRYRTICDNEVYSYQNEQNDCSVSSKWQSTLSYKSTRPLLNNLACNGNNLNCKPIPNLHEESFQQFLSSFSGTPSNQTKPDKVSQKINPVLKAPIKDKIRMKQEEVRVIENNTFRTANEELELQNLKIYHISSTEQSSQKRKPDLKKNVLFKFVSPMLSNNTNNFEKLGSNENNYTSPTTDERLKNIDPKMVDLIRSEIMDTDAVVTWDDIAGLEFAKTSIQEAIVWPLLRPDIFTGLRRPSKGFLLFGPPGTGKTLIGKCVASQSKSTFFSISASSLTSKWIGDGEKMVRALFTVAKCHQPAVIFIDEIDSLLSQRSDTEHESSRRIKTEFLVQLDGATTDHNERILVVGATNRPQELDEAARRRFVKRLYIPLPDAHARLQIVTRLMRQEKNSLTTEQLKEIAELSEGYSGADMQNLCSEASLGPIRNIDISQMQNIHVNEVRPIDMDDFATAFTRVKASVSRDDLNQYITWNKTFGCGFA